MQEIDKFKDENGGISRENIKKIVPYEDPFLFIDSVLKLTKREIVATKEIKAGEPYFKGHFKGFPISAGIVLVLTPYFNTNYTHALDPVLSYLRRPGFTYLVSTSS